MRRHCAPAACAPMVVFMPESQEDIDALLENVSALAAEAASDIAGDEGGATAAEEADASADLSPPASSPAADAGAFVPPRDPAPAMPVAPPRRNATASDIQRILHLEVPVIVRLAETTMPLSKILGLSTGAIIEFEKPSDSMLNLMINNKCIGHGQAVKVGENFGLRVGVIGTVRDRIEALGE